MYIYIYIESEREMHILAAPTLQPTTSKLVLGCFNVR